MPKIIENIREKLIQEAKRQVMELGYSSMTIRSVASACGVGVGTVYNYFSSKDMLVVSFMLEDWFLCKQEIVEGCSEGKTPEMALACIYNGLRTFISKYETLFRDEGAGASVKTSASKERHKMLCDQIAKPLLPFCQMQTKVKPEFLAEFLAEALVGCACREDSFEDVKSVLLQLF